MGGGKRSCRKAASSIALNLAEGNRRGGKDKPYHFRVAALDIEMQRRQRAEGEGGEPEPGPSRACRVLTEDGCSAGDGTGNELPASPADGSSSTDRAA